MKRLFTLAIALGLTISSFAQIQSLAGPRIGVVYISSSPSSAFLNGTYKLEDLGELPEDYNAKGTLTTLYGWQFESRFADGGNVTGIVEWIVLVAGMEKGYFLPSVSSMVGARTESGLEFAIGPNLSMSGVAFVLGMGYNFKSGNLNIPVNIGFVPGIGKTYYKYLDDDPGPDGEWDTPDDIRDKELYHVNYNTGNRFSITVGFNLSK